MNRKNVMTLVMLAGLGTSVFAVGFLGSPTAELGQGKWSIGYDYSYTSQDFKDATMKGSWLATLTGLPDVDGTTNYKAKLKDFNIQRHYATICYGVTSDWDVYVKLGVADVKGKARRTAGGVIFPQSVDPIEDEWNGYNFNNNFAWGWGTRYTFARQDNVAWGAAVQMNWLNTEWTSKFPDPDPAFAGTVKNKIEFKSYDLLISAGPSVDLGGWKLYGGPFYYYINGDLKSSASVFSEDIVTGDIYTSDEKSKGDIKAKSNFGGFLGAQFNLAQDMKMTIELASTTKGGWGLGTGIVWTF